MRFPAHLGVSAVEFVFLLEIVDDVIDLLIDLPCCSVALGLLLGFQPVHDGRFIRCESSDGFAGDSECFGRPVRRRWSDARWATGAESVAGHRV